MAERRKRRHPARRVLGIALAVVGLAAGAGVLAWWLDRLEGPPPAPAPSPGFTSPAPTASPTASPTVPASLQACVAAVERGAAAVGRARPAVADWAAHVKAQTDLDAGRNTMAETERIWARTRARGPGGVTAFGAADTAYRRVAGACQQPLPADVDGDVAAAAATCRRASRQTDLVLAAARRAVQDWAAHLKAMADRRSGRIGAAHAAEQWRAAYRAAPININRFDAAERVYRAHPPCGVPH
jgi:hypothetical protein